MGGYGSGRPRVHTAVEDCWCLDMGEWVRRGVIAPSVRHTGSWEWRNRRDEIINVVDNLVDTLDCMWAFVELEYVVGYMKEPYRYCIPLVIGQLGKLLKQ